MLHLLYSFLPGAAEMLVCSSARYCLVVLQDSSGKSPFDLASDFKHKAVCRILKGVIK